MIPILARHHRVIVPDLLGLGDTVVHLNDDHRLPSSRDDRRVNGPPRARERVLIIVKRRPSRLTMFASSNVLKLELPLGIITPGWPDLQGNPTPCRIPTSLSD
jgi:hypothetical protein